MASTHGGKRPGAGRPKGSGKFKEPTKSVRVPLTWVAQLERGEVVERLPLFSGRVRAGFLSPAEDHVEERLNLHEYVVHHPEATFFVRVQGDSMIGASIHEGDVLVVDRSLEPKNGAVVIAVVDGELTVKRLVRERGRTSLVAENEKYPPIVLQEGQELRVWGVVTFVVHQV